MVPMTEGTQATALTVGQLAGQFAITVRTLHHYDEIGLLTPERTQQRRLPALHRDGHHPAAAHRRLPPARVRPRGDLAAAGAPGERASSTCAGSAPRSRAGWTRCASSSRPSTEHWRRSRTGMKLTKQEQQELFGDGYSDEYAAEAEQRWGDTDALAAVPAAHQRLLEAGLDRDQGRGGGRQRGVRGGQAGRAGGRLGSRRWTRPSSTAGTSTTGSTTCPTSSTATWGTCTSPTRGSPDLRRPGAGPGPVRPGRDPRQRGSARRVARGSPGVGERGGRVQDQQGDPPVPPSRATTDADRIGCSSPRWGWCCSAGARRASPVRRPLDPRRPAPPVTDVGRPGRDGARRAGRLGVPGQHRRQQHPDVRRRAGAQRQQRARVRLPGRAVGCGGEHRDRRASGSGSTPPRCWSRRTRPSRSGLT